MSTLERPLCCHSLLSHLHLVDADPAVSVDPRFCCRRSTRSDPSSEDEVRSSSSDAISATSIRRYSSHSRHGVPRADGAHLQDAFWADSRVRADTSCHGAAVQV
jgi:hypothetical protein